MSGDNNINTKNLIDRKGLQFRLFRNFLLFAVLIIVAIGLIQIFAIRNLTRQDTKANLQDTARGISANYGTESFENIVRAVIGSGEYRVRVINEEGELLIDPSFLSNYIMWPEIDMSDEAVFNSLPKDKPYFYTEKTDSEGERWIVYGEVIAKWDNVREVLLITKSTASENLRTKRQIGILVIASLAILAFSFLLSWYVAKSYLKPIRKLTDRAVDLANGNYDVEFPASEYTEINDLSDTMKMAADSMANYEQNRRDMIAHVSHDMRTPLTMIKAYAEMIQTISGDNPEKRNQHLDIIIEQSDNLSDFVNKTLDLSQLQSRTYELNKTVFSLGNLMQSIVVNYNTIEKSDIDYILDIDNDTYVYADESRIEQIIRNLISNSQKYGNGLIKLKVKTISSANIVRMEIIDNGDGIADEAIKNIWTKYYRVNPYGKNSGGAGVGLSIVKEIADLHEIKYGAEGRNGARFWFDFPCVEKE